MATSVKEKITKLKVFYQSAVGDIKKTRIITINNVDDKATNDALYQLAEALSSLVYDDMSKVVRADDQVLTQA